MQVKSFHVTASNKVSTKETHRQKTKTARKTPVTQQGPQPRALHQGSAVKSGTVSKFGGPNKISWQRTPEEKFASRNGARQGPTLEDAKGKKQGACNQKALERERRKTRRREGLQDEERNKKANSGREDKQIHPGKARGTKSAGRAKKGDQQPAQRIEGG